MGYFGIPGINDHTEGIEYKKPIPIDEFLKNRDSTPKELIELRSLFFNQKDRFKKTVSIPFEGGTFYAKPNTSIINPSKEPIISFYPDNTEYNVANAKNFQDLEALQQIYTTVGGIGAAMSNVKPQAPNWVLQKPGLKVQIPVTQKGMTDAKNLSKIIDGVNNLSRFKTIPKYSSSTVVQTKDGPLYRPTPGTMTSTFMTTTGGNDLVPEWLFSWKGTQFENTSDKLGLNATKFDNPQQERTWYAKLTYQRVLDEVIRQGGTKLQAQQLFAEKRDFFEPLIDKRTGERKGKGIVATITELNNMMDKWMPGIQVRTTPSVKNGVEIYRYQFKDVDGRFTTWDLERKQVDELVNYSKTTFAKDHMIPVKDRSRIGGGYIGADNPSNFEIIYQFVNNQKSNKYQLPKGLLKEMGVPNSLSEWVNMKLYPQNYEGMFVPQRWKENFQKIVLAEYYEKTKGLQSANKKKAVMDKLVRTWSAFFKDQENVRALEMLEEALGQQVAKNMEEGVAAGNEVPAWLGLLQKPPGGWNSKDPWWTSLSKDAQTRYRYIYDYKQRTITPYRRSPQGTKDYEL
tara:strand:+ start:173 stop:1882 length:1710 start_codon:yes stop_codon:yes gene_type:complete